MNVSNNIKSSPARSELRIFGLSLGLVFLAIGVWPMRNDMPLRIWSLIISTALILPALLAPLFLTAPLRLWMKFGGIMGWVNTRLILTLLYFFAILPVAIILKISGKTPLKLKFDRKAESYREKPEDHDLFDPRQQY